MEKNMKKNTHTHTHIYRMYQFSSVPFSHSVMSDSLRPHELQHARPPCPSPSPGVHSNSCPSSWWCHPAIILCHPLFLLPPIPPHIRVFSNESTLHMRWPKQTPNSPLPGEGSPKRDCNHPKNSLAHSLRYCRIWMFFLKMVRLSLT